MSDLMAVERARELLASAHAVDEVKDVLDKATALGRYLRQRGASVESINYCAQIKIRAERRTGELTLAMPKAPPVGERAGRGRKIESPESGPTIPTKQSALDLAGLSKQRAAEFEKIAKIPEARFEEAIARATALAVEAGDALTTAAIVAAATQTSAAADYDSDEWYTPPEHVALVRQVLGEIDLDAASNSHAQATVKAARYFTKADDALRREWDGRVFLNPPFSMPLIAEFVEKLIAEYDAKRVTAAVLLVNNCTDVSWFHSLLERFPVCFTRGRISFLTRAGQKFANRQGQAFFYLGKARARFAKVFAEIGTVVAS